ncbi:MAG: CHAT domain-containing protein [bacterium]|nr:CHAT domain-containing protein [bacterium]
MRSDDSGSTLHIRRRTIIAGACCSVVVALAALLAGAAPLSPMQQHNLAHIDSLHVSGQVDSAATFIEPRLARATATGDSLFILPLTAKLGRLWASFGQPRRGEPLLRQAADLAVALGDSSRLADALRWLGYTVEQQGQSDEATKIYHRLLAVALPRDDQRHEAWARVGLAFRAGQEGRTVESTADYRRAVELFEDLGDTPAALWTLNGLGAVLQLDGRYAEAVDCFRRAAGLAAGIGYTAVEALALNNQGTVEFALGDPGVAMDHFRRAAELQRAISQHQDAITSRTNVALCLTHLGRLDEAANLLGELLDECVHGNFDDRKIDALIELAAIRRLQDRHHEAVAIHRRVLAHDDEVMTIRNRVEATAGLAAGLAELDSSAVALVMLRAEAGPYVEHMSGETRITYELALAQRLSAERRPEAALGHYRVATDLTGEGSPQWHRVAALAGLALCRRDLGQEEVALARLHEAARAWEHVRAASSNPEWREQRGASGRLVYSQLAALILADDLAGDNAARAFDAVQIFKGRTLAERIAGGDDRPPMTLNQLQRKVLADDEVFLDAYLGPRESVLFAVTGTEIRAVVLPDEKSLTARLRLHHELLATPPAATSTQRSLAVLEVAGERLRRELLEPFVPLLAGRRVIYAPDGVLNLVPLAALIPRGDPAVPVAWVRVPSAAILGRLRSGDDPGRSARGMLAYAAVATPDGRALPGAAREVRRLAHDYRDVDLKLAAAVAPEDLAPYALLHLAAHARADDQRPWYSEIVLDPEAPAGRLRAEQVAQLDLSAHLAVLSACETGTGRVLSGEGVIGLTGAFLGAGVPAVVASLWRVPDAATSVLMERFYTELAAGRDVATALASAQRAVRHEPATAHPFHWAGFVVVGDGAATIELHVRRDWTAPMLFLTGGLVVVVGILLLRRSSRAALSQPD